MCKMISSDSVIGNYVLASVKNKHYEIRIDDLLIFEKKLSSKLKVFDYYTNFNSRGLERFMDNYPFFVKSINETTIFINDETFEQDVLSNKLERYFKLGMPGIVINNITEVTNDMLECD